MRCCASSSRHCRMAYSVLGAGQSPARQAIRLAEWSVTRRSWASRQDILQLLRAGTGTAIAQDKLTANQEITLKEGRLIVALDLRTASPQCLSGDNGTQARCHLHNGKQVHRAICVPGGTMKVYLRRRTERFLRCVLGSGRDERREPLDPPRPQRLRQDALGLHLLFGEHSGPDSQGDSPIAQCALPSGTKAQAATNGGGALDVHDLVGWRLLDQDNVPTCRIGHSHNGKRNGNGEVVIRQMGEEEFQLPDRDAFCSQSSPREIVDVPAQPIVWSPLILELDLREVSDRRSRPAVCGLFLAMLSELAHSGIQVKAGRFVGWEKLEIERVRFDVQGLDGPLALLDDVTLNQGDFGNLPAEVQQCLVPLWIAWLSRFAAQESD
ncbi:MAG: hypothetical protein KatS3mg109_1795 [Pirellulaceae bacterium]|nr:MAG: hypothetical protein KatS3mg109_1795 [Pirellulaceae bacterium]